MLFSLPIALLGQAVGQAAMPQLAALAAGQKYIRLRQTLSKVLLAVLALSVLAALILALLGRPTIHLLFQHGAFNAHSSSLTNLALLGYAIALPGQALVSLLLTTFYAMKNALLPLCSSIVALLAHLGGLFFFLHAFSGSSQILAIPLAMALDGVATSLLLGSLLFLNLHGKARRDKGMQRLARRRVYVDGLNNGAKPRADRL
jgi:putative peptidoglycan lipid II flippase